MNKIRTLIIEDNDKSRDTLKLLVERLDTCLLFVGVADTVNSGLDKIKELKPDLIFLDVELPDGDGFSLLESLDSIDFEIIFMTGFNQYAVKAIKHSALDYLIKPFGVIELKRQ